MKELLKIAWPLIIANGFWNFQLTIDRIFLGNYSTEALGATMAVMGIFWTPMALLQQTSAYITTFVSQYLGAKQTENISIVFWQAIYISIIGGLLFLILNLFSYDFFNFIGHEKSVRDLEISYFNAISFSALPTAIVAVISGLFTGQGKTRPVMWINGIGLVFNAILDYLLIFGNFGFPKLGIVGAGIATSAAGWASVLFGIWLLIANKSINFFESKNCWHWNSPIIKRFLKFGIPSGLQWALEGLAFSVFLILIGRYHNGVAALSSSSIAVTIMQLSILPTLGVAQAVMMKVGLHLGEKNPHLAEKSTWDGIKLSWIYMFAASLSFLIFPEQYINLFSNNSDLSLWSEVFNSTIVLLKFVALFTLFESLTLNFSMSLKGAGDTKFVSFVSLILPWPLMVLPSWLVASKPNALILAWSFVTFYCFVLSMVLFFRFRNGAWKKMSVIN